MRNIFNYRFFSIAVFGFLAVMAMSFNKAGVNTRSQFGNTTAITLNSATVLESAEPEITAALRVIGRVVGQAVTRATPVLEHVLETGGTVGVAVEEIRPDVVKHDRLLSKL